MLYRSSSAITNILFDFAPPLIWEYIQIPTVTAHFIQLTGEAENKIPNDTFNRTSHRVVPLCSPEWMKIETVRDCKLPSQRAQPRCVQCKVKNTSVKSATQKRQYAIRTKHQARKSSHVLFSLQGIPVWNSSLRPRVRPIVIFWLLGRYLIPGI